MHMSYIHNGNNQLLSAFLCCLCKALPEADTIQKYSFENTENEVSC